MTPVIIRLSQRSLGWPIRICKLARRATLALTASVVLTGMLVAPTVAAPDPQLPAAAPSPYQVSWAAPGVMAAPYRSQFDGSIYESSNCGPATLSMALGALGINANPINLRHLADAQMHSTSPYNGTTWEALVAATTASGARTQGLYAPSGYYQIWTLDQLKSELLQGHPVVILVHYRDLPDHLQSTYNGDHYVVVLGFRADGTIIYNDPAFRVGSGADRTMTQAQLLQAWSHTSVGLIRTAFAVTR